MHCLADDKTEGKNIEGVWFEDSYIRKYPLGTFACDTVGFASANNGGELGIESQYELSYKKGGVWRC